MNDRIASGFDFLAPVYDRLAQLAIGKEMIASQIHFLPVLNTCNRILILGGGSGLILDYLRTAGHSVEIDYIDISPKMLAAARKRKSHTVNFIQGTEAAIPQNNYDGVITNFYLDMFDVDGLTERVEIIKKNLTNGARWIVTDFVNESTSQALRLWCMYRFFRAITKIQATHLADWQTLMRKSGFNLLEGSKFHNGFIVSNLYQFRNSTL